MRLCDKRGYFSAKWNHRQPRETISRCSTLVVPGYVVPRSVFERVRLIGALRGWGASEAAITVKAFFLNIDLLHVCGPLARHFFRPNGKIPYATPWRSVWRNHALVARLCFDDRAWFEHWLPNVFDKHLSAQSRKDLESAEVLREHESFLAEKQRPDREFWRGLMHTEEPPCLKI